MKSALIFWGGWNGHTPEQTAELLAGQLRANDFEVRIETSLDALLDAEALKKLNLIVPMWTMGQITKAQSAGLCGAVKGGVGLAGVHGGMGDSFRGNIEYEWMVGGHFVGHPYVGDYTVKLTKKSPLTEGLPAEFPYKSEQYYMLVDPANDVLAETIYDREGRKVTMPVIWTRKWGEGKVFYSALGHTADELKKYPAVLEMTVKGMLWAAK